MPVDGRFPAVDETFTIAPPPSRSDGQGGANRAHVAHDVELPVGIPLLVGHLLEARLPRDADVVDENVEATESVHRLGDGALGLAGERQVGRRRVRPRRLRAHRRRPHVTTRAPSPTS